LSYTKTTINKNTPPGPPLLAALFLPAYKNPPRNRISGQRTGSGPRNTKTTGTPPVIFTLFFSEPLIAFVRRFYILGMFTL
jgi:hypothetical protein